MEEESDRVKRDHILGNEADTTQEIEQMLRDTAGAKAGRLEGMEPSCILSR